VVQVTVYAPGAYAEVRLPCVPDVDYDGVTGITTVMFTVGELPVYLFPSVIIVLTHSVDCHKTSYSTSPTPRAYFEFSVLVLRY